MAELHVELGDSLPLFLQLSDGASGKFPQAHVYDDTDSEDGSSPFDLTHVDNGLYTNSSFTPGSTGFYRVVYITYSDSGHTTEDTNYPRVVDFFEVDTRLADLTDLNDTKLTSARASNLDNLDASVSSRESESSASSRASTNQTEHDSTQSAISALNDPSAATIADAVWDETLADHTLSGSTGKALSDIEGNVDNLQSSDQTLVGIIEPENDMIGSIDEDQKLVGVLDEDAELA